MTKPLEVCPKLCWCWARWQGDDVVVPNLYSSQVIFHLHHVLDLLLVVASCTLWLSAAESLAMSSCG